jgi:hypothetical protein
MTSEQRGQLNRRISEARGIKAIPKLAYLDGWLDKDGKIVVDSDWSGDDRANCVLLDEVVDNYKGKDHYNGCTALGEIFFGKYERRIAVCIAWCRWKHITVEDLL